MSMNKLRSSFALGVSLLLMTVPARADVKVNGATTPMYWLMKPSKAKIE